MARRQVDIEKIVQLRSSSPYGIGVVLCRTPTGQWYRTTRVQFVARQAHDDITLTPFKFMEEIPDA